MRSPKAFLLILDFILKGLRVFLKGLLTKGMIE